MGKLSDGELVQAGVELAKAQFKEFLELFEEWRTDRDVGHYRHYADQILSFWLHNHADFVDWKKERDEELNI